MERVGVLVNRLFEQYQQNESPERLLITVQLLLGELQHRKASSSASEKVAVLMPVNLHAAQPTEEISIAEGDVMERPQASFQADEKEMAAFIFPETNIEKLKYKWGYDPLRDVPTLAHQNKELNEVMTSKDESLNDRLKMAHTELGTVLTETPIADLRKAIGINDRFLFINELFGGDGTTYERCIKTINSFNSMAEAEYWIKKELKLKLGWPEKSETVKYFDQLVKRRFS